MAKMKVAELPQEQRDKLIAEAKELEIRGIVAGWTVETLETKIAEAKAQKQNQQANEQNTQANEQNNGNDEQNTQNDEQNNGNDEQNTQNDEQNDEGVIVAGDGGVHSIPPKNEQAPAEEKEETQEQNQEIPAEEESEPQENAQNEGNETPVDAPVNEEKKETEEQLPPGTVTKKAAKQAPKKTPICHICRSKVIDGECQGCGFKVVR